MYDCAYVVSYTFFWQDQIQTLRTVVSDMLSAWNSGSISSSLFEKRVNYIIRLGNVKKDSLFSKMIVALLSKCCILSRFVSMTFSFIQTRLAWGISNVCISDVKNNNLLENVHNSSLGEKQSFCKLTDIM